MYLPLAPPNLTAWFSRGASSKSQLEWGCKFRQGIIWSILNLIDQVKQELEIDLTSSVGRYLIDGWYFQGISPVLCERCRTPYAVFRCPYTTSKGSYKYWALVCDGCKSVSSLDEVPDSEKKFLRKWDTTVKPAPEVGVVSRDLLSKKEIQIPIQKSQPQKSNKAIFMPTGEQQLILEAVGRGGDISVQALAGTGKTTTLSLIAEQVKPKRGHYVAFNRAIVNEARSKFPSNITCVTAHGLAFRGLGHHFKSRLDSPRVSHQDLAELFNIKGFGFRTAAGSYFFEPFQMAQFATKTVGNFCKGIGAGPGPKDVPSIPLVDVDDQVANEFKSQILNYVNGMWADLQKQTGLMKFEHDHYLKMWQLAKPEIPGDILLFDEAQDADLVMLDVVNSQQAQLVYCGDSFQAIYEWRGAVDALELVNVDETKWLTQSFRFGDSIAEIGNSYLKRLDAEVQIKGLESRKSLVGQVQRPDAILCRTNFGAISSLILSQEQGRKSALMGNVKVSLEQFAVGCRDLMYGRRTGHPDLAPFKNWNEAFEWAHDESASSMAGDVATLIQLVENITVEQMLKCLAAAVEEKDSEVVISTAHRAKGREWNSVRLAGDFKHPDDMDTADLRLTYVAVTRAKENLDIGQFPKSKGDTPPLFKNLGSKTISKNSSTPRKQRPPIDSNRQVNASASVPKQRGILKRLLGD